MRNSTAHRYLTNKIAVLCLIVFSCCVFHSCADEHLDFCSVTITSPSHGTILEEGAWLDFGAHIESWKENPFRKYTYLPRISRVTWTSDKDGVLMVQTYDPAEEDVDHSFSTNSLSVNVHEITCTTYWESGGNHWVQCSDSILINVNEKAPDTTTTTTTMIDLSLFNHVKITVRTVKEYRISYEAPVEDFTTDVLSDSGHEGSFSGFDYAAEWLDPADAVTNVEQSGSISITLSSTENAVTYVKYHREEDDLDEDSVYNYTIDLETTSGLGISLINSSTTSLIFRVNGLSVCDYIEQYETIKVMNQTTTVTRIHRYCDENSVLEIYFYH